LALVVILSNNLLLPWLSEYGPQLAIPIFKSTDFKLKFEAKGPGGLRPDLMKTLTDFSYYISIVIHEKQVDLRYISDYIDY